MMIFEVLSVAFFVGVVVAISLSYLIRWPFIVGAICGCLTFWLVTFGALLCLPGQ